MTRLTENEMIGFQNDLVSFLELTGLSSKDGGRILASLARTKAINALNGILMDAFVVGIPNTPSALENMGMVLKEVCEVLGDISRS